MQNKKTRKPIAYLTSANLIGFEGVAKREDHFEHDLQVKYLRDGCEAYGMDLHEICWEEDRNFRQFEATIIGTNWDYWDKRTAFLEKLTAISDQTLLLNPLSIVEWNLDKHYLTRLNEQYGIDVIPTIYASSSDLQACEAALEAFNCEQIVVKPQIGAGAWRQFIWRRGEVFPEATARPPADCLIQPFVQTVQSHGEISVIALGSELSHALVKKPKKGDYRVQSLYGGWETPLEISEDLHGEVIRVLNAVQDPFLHARVDLLPKENGEGFYLIELEMIEPYLYPEQGPELGHKFARRLTEILE